MTLKVVRLLQGFSDANSMNACATFRAVSTDTARRAVPRRQRSFLFPGRRFYGRIVSDELIHIVFCCLCAVRRRLSFSCIHEPPPSLYSGGRQYFIPGQRISIQIFKIEQNTEHLQQLLNCNLYASLYSSPCSVYMNLLAPYAMHLSHSSVGRLLSVLTLASVRRICR